MSRSFRAPVAVLSAALVVGVFAAVGLAAAPAGAVAPSAADYRLTELPVTGTRGGYFPVAVAGGIAVGITHSDSNSTTLPAFVWNAGTISDLPAPTTARVSRVEGINASGLIIGEGFNADTTSATTAQPMVWNASTPGTATVLTQPVGGATYGFGIAVNGGGQLLASQTPIAGQGQKPYFYASSAATPQLVGSGFDTTAGATAIGLADSGAILASVQPVGGAYGYYLLPTPDATPAQSTPLDFRPTAISPNGTVAGVNTAGTAAVLRTPAGVESTLAMSVRPSAVNDAGAWVGVNVVSPYQGVLVQGSVVTDLATLMPGWSLIGPMGIDASGDIVGSALDAQGRNHGFVLTHAPSTNLSISLSASPDRIAPTGSTTVTATISNAGSATATGVSVGLTSSPADHITIGSATPPNVADLTGGASTTVSWVVSASQEGTYGLTAQLAWTDPSLGARTASARLSLPVANQGIVVNSTGDAPLTTLATTNKVCDTDDQTAGNQCTLRAAIQTANLLGAGGTSVAITFDIPGLGVPTIRPASALPAITAKVALDGSSQGAGWVAVNGAAAGGPGAVDGLTVTGGGSSIRGLVLGGWKTAIVLSGAGGDVVAGNRIGTNLAGTAADPNTDGILVRAADVRIGALTGNGMVCDGDCNVISGNTGNGITDGGHETPELPLRLTIVGNLIGSDVTGEVAITNGGNAVDLEWRGFSANRTSADAVQIGGPTSRAGVAPGNLIAGKVLVASTLNPGGDQHPTFALSRIQGNLVGADWTGTRVLTRVDIGIAQGSGSFDLVGGPDAADANVVVGTTGYGIYSGGAVDHNVVGLGLDGRPLGNAAGFTAAAGGILCNNVISGNDVGVVSGDLAGGNRIGTDATGTRAIPNRVGVSGSSHSLLDSRCAATSYDVVSGNTEAAFSANTNLSLEHTLIGTDATGDVALPNGAGILGSPLFLTLGGPIAGTSGSVSCAAPCVVIAGNTGAAVDVASGARNPMQLQIEGVSIGVGTHGGALPNGGGVHVAGAISPNHVGIIDSTIAHTSGPAIQLDGASASDTDPFRIERNTISDAATGVTLADAGRVRVANNTVHDVRAAVEVTGGAATPDLSGNALYRITGSSAYTYPPFTQAIGMPGSPTATLTGGVVTVAGGSPSASVSSYRIDVYGEATCSARSAGLYPLGSFSVQSGLIDVTTGFTGRVRIPDALQGTVTGVLLTATDTSTPAFGGTAFGHTGHYTSCLTLATPAPQASLSDTTAAIGQRVTVSGSGFAPGEQVSVTLHSTPVLLTTVTASPTGTVTATVTIPAGTTPGAHQIVLTGADSGVTIAVDLTATAPDALAALASTGVDAVAAAEAALATLLLGSALVALTIHRRRSRIRRSENLPC